MADPISRCCFAPMRVAGSQTKYYACSVCGSAADPAKLKPRIFKRGSHWILSVGPEDEWVCYAGWVGAMGFLRALYRAGEVARIQLRIQRWEHVG